MPECFANLKDLAVIIDCFEIFIEKSSNLLARAETWSQYKHHNTVEIVIVIKGQGTISHILKAWEERTSDKHIVENSGLLDHIIL